MADQGNGSRFVTVTELADKIAALRWELRFYVLALVAVVLLKFNVPVTTAARVARFLF